jgi:hypothetical protein
MQLAVVAYAGQVVGALTVQQAHLQLRRQRQRQQPT